MAHSGSIYLSIVERGYIRTALYKMRAEGHLSNHQINKIEEILRKLA